MPPNTAQFTELMERVAELGSHMLPATKADLTYTAAQYDHVRAYVLLVHAEVEAFLEQRIRDEVRRRVEAWKRNRTPSSVLMGMLAFREGQWTSPIESLDSPSEGDAKRWRERDVGARLDLCHEQLVSLLEKNNGVKAKDVLSMLVRIGLAVDSIDSELVSELDALGMERGTFAHSAVRAVKTLPDPEVCKGRVKNILTKLESLDVAISALA